MTYDARQMSALTYANGFTLWHYRTDDGFEEVVGEGYFDDAHNLVRDGDIVICAVDAGGDVSRTFMGIMRKHGGRVYLVPIAGEEVVP